METLLTAIAHVGIRVANFERARDFYALLGFRLTGGPYPPEPVAILRHPSGIEINLIVNAKPGDRPHNVLMDEPVKHAGFTHIALSCRSIEQAESDLARAGVKLSGGPTTFPDGHRAIFVRDPDGNVIELNQG
ncbi:MAG TPA: VOC family protein [Polyangiaceae bacterium]